MITGAFVGIRNRGLVHQAAQHEHLIPKRRQWRQGRRPFEACAFGGRDKKTLFILARGAQDAAGNEVANAAQVWSIQTIAQGHKGRAK